MKPQEFDKLRDRVEELERLIGIGAVRPRPWGLTRREADVFGVLLKRCVVSHDQLFEAIWGGDSECSTKCVEVMVHKLRAKLRPHGIVIQSERGVGYFIPRESKNRARALLANREQVSA